MSDRIRAVVFDLGGVLVDLDGPPPLPSAASAPGEAWAAWLASPDVRAFESGRIDARAFASRIVGPSDGAESFLERFASWPLGVHPDALDLVRRIGCGVIRATMSNSNPIHWARFAGLGLLGAFDAHFPSHLTGLLKPDPEAFEHVATRLGCRPAQILLLDDQPVNVEAARAAGMRAEPVAGVDGAAQALIAAGLLAPARA